MQNSYNPFTPGKTLADCRVIIAVNSITDKSVKGRGGTAGLEKKRKKVLTEQKKVLTERKNNSLFYLTMKK